VGRGPLNCLACPAGGMIITAMAFGPGWLPAGAAYDQAGPRPSWVALSQVALVAVTDACAVASSACHVARSDTASVLVSLAGTGRSNVFIGEDVEAELPEALQKVAADMGNPLADAERALSRIVTRIRVVPLQMGDYLNPAIAAIRRCDPAPPAATRMTWARRRSRRFSRPRSSSARTACSTGSAWRFPPTGGPRRPPACWSLPSMTQPSKTLPTPQRSAPGCCSG